MGYGGGHSEEVIGQAFANNRDKVKIASKIGPKCDPASPAEEAYPYEWVIECTEKSLKRLNTDYLDLQQIHTWRDHYTEESGWFRAMQKLKEDGKIRSIGVSAECWKPDGAVRIAESGKIDSIQVIYNVFDQQPIEKLFPAAIANNVGIIVRVSLFEGLLAGKIRAGHKWVEGDESARTFNLILDDAVETSVNGMIRHDLNEVKVGDKAVFTFDMTPSANTHPVYHLWHLMVVTKDKLTKMDIIK